MRINRIKSIINELYELIRSLCNSGFGLTNGNLNALQECAAQNCFGLNYQGLPQFELSCPSPYFENDDGVVCNYGIAFAFGTWRSARYWRYERKHVFSRIESFLFAPNSILLGFQSPTNSLDLARGVDGQSL